MKGVENAIPLVLGVIIAGAILVISFTVMSQAREGIENIWETGASFQQRVDAMDNLYMACKDWSTGDRYNADKILNTYKLPDRMRPYRDAWGSCGEELLELAQRCYKSSEQYGGCAGNGYVDAEELGVCSNVCTNVETIYEKCEVACSDSVLSCFETIMQDANLWKAPGKFSVLSGELEHACGG